MEYTIDKTAPTIYLDPTGNAIQGYRVTVTLIEFNETHYVQVPDLGPATVKAKVEKLLSDRKALATLSEPSGK